MPRTKSSAPAAPSAPLREFQPEIEEMIKAWDALSGAIQSTLCATPAQMSGAAERLEAEHRAMREMMFGLMRSPLAFKDPA